MERIGNINFAEKPHALSCYRQIAGLVGKAYQKSFAIAIAVGGFRTVPLYPSTLHVFDAHDCPEQNSVQQCD
jgi:hypothetical protein